MLAAGTFVAAPLAAASAGGDFVAFEETEGNPVADVVQGSWYSTTGTPTPSSAATAETASSSSTAPTLVMLSAAASGSSPAETQRWRTGRSSRRLPRSSTRGSRVSR
jgi:hypothetical protein